MGKRETVGNKAKPLLQLVADIIIISLLVYTVVVQEARIDVLQSKLDVLESLILSAMIK